MSVQYSELAGSVFSELIAEQLTQERAVKSSLEQRGSLVITTSGTLVALLFGLGAVVSSRKDFEVPFDVRVLFAIALGFFVLAAVLGLLANLPWRYREVDERAMRRLVAKDLWNGPLVPATRRVAEAYVDVLEATRGANELKGRAVRLALGAEIAAVALLSAAIVTVLV
jgi:hypothetical protein